MATIKPFECLRPNETVAHRVAALPYDVYDREEAKAKVAEDELTFLRIDRAETQFPDSVDTYDPIVYRKAKELLEARTADGTFISDNDRCYYIYELIMNGRHQTGIVACASIDDYAGNVIKKHENTREEKEIDRINHVDICNAQTGPIFLAYRSDEIISSVVERYKNTTKPIYSFTADDGIRHNVWKIGQKQDISTIENEFGHINSIYIADGHHRAASAVRVGFKRRAESGMFRGNEEFNFFLSVLFPEDQLMIMPYNRVVKDLNGYSVQSFINEISKNFTVTKTDVPFAPDEKCTFGMFVEDTWYKLEASDTLKKLSDPVASLDVSILQDYLLGPVLSINDPRKDKRIDFIGGIRGLKELERRVHHDMKIAFAMYPTSIRELFAVSDAGRLMPPKSTWFEPKLRSGLFIHRI
ncbi:MAG: DUF1015 family protein [Lachnospiraceae bacterium]|nr:DUF1015 family protein [Lachnospiraceae bacterium]